MLTTCKPLAWLARLLHQRLGSTGLLVGRCCARLAYVMLASERKEGRKEATTHAGHCGKPAERGSEAAEKVLGRTLLSAGLRRHTGEAAGS